MILDMLFEFLLLFRLYDVHVKIKFYVISGIKPDQLNLTGVRKNM